MTQNAPQDEENSTDSPELMRRLPYVFARAQGVVLDSEAGGGLIALLRPDADLSALAEAQRVAGRVLSVQEIDAKGFEERLTTLYQNSASEAAEQAAGENDSLSALAEDAASVDDLLDQSNDAPVVRLINALLLEAIRERASDMHVEIEEQRLVIRFRIDGVLREVLEPRRALGSLLVSRLKVMGKLDIAEKRLPQDGRVSLRVGDHALDIRISTLPSQFGERVVLRLLDRAQTGLGIAALGLSHDDESTLIRAITAPDGLVLVTGPTGSGKTTSLYAALHHLNDRSRNILTVEDPIEYALEGVGQMQVNTRTQLTFARGLRAILRQDPDVIMVGEIRDAETARIAVESAMTGHLVLSTLHTNTAIGAISRLADMGVERFLLAPMIRCLMAQRLVRRLCPSCRVADSASMAEAELLSEACRPGSRLWRPVGCEGCAGQGYRGRLAIYEVVPGNRRLESLIHSGASEEALQAAAREVSCSMLQDGTDKILEGLTSVEEVLRAVRENTNPSPSG